ncbi:hypothetical protein DLAC_09086 [Tieghemostelium lacteum]|uniref:AB hydrolase-1 domain-containing protein n=1 Tax=Tieghemostelium lacteum TaxID=361077 RepID=A0A151Z953_TIELA|nr:hypothetical protein DLAC_09086 [Tieghemostelium lacteum]|eukprot:KYQ90463.1 hypothetical protein DLAC_09086 [Tieghemostelium lacteum]
MMIRHLIRNTRYINGLRYYSNGNKKQGDMSGSLGDQLKDEHWEIGWNDFTEMVCKGPGQGPEPHYDKIISGFKTFHYKTPVEFKLGGQLPDFKIAYETWGKLNENRDNAILLHTGLSASSHAKSHQENQKPGWWEEFIGPGLAIDTNRFYVICTNVIGGCFGSTGPSSVNPLTGKRWALDFPSLTIDDMVQCQFKLLDSLGIQKLYASVGSSMGGMQSLSASAQFPERVGRMITISSAGRSHPLSMAMRYTQRMVLMSDPCWMEGAYYDKTFPFTGMKHAREIGTITYRSGPEWNERFGRKKISDNPRFKKLVNFGSSLHSSKKQGKDLFLPEFEIEAYLDYQGKKFCSEYDPNSLLYLSKAMDLFDMGEGQESYEKGLHRIKCPTMVLGVDSDILFPSYQQREIANILKQGGTPTTYYELHSIYGHDTFLIDIQTIGSAIKGHLESLHTLRKP